jgi:hypothetical protein
MSFSGVETKIGLAAGTSILSAVAAFIEPITGFLKFIAAVVAIVAGIYAIRVSRKNLK